MANGNAHNRKKPKPPVSASPLETTRPKMPESYRPKPKLHPLFKWLRTASGAAQLFGWGSLMLGGSFWIGASLIYLGFLLVAIDLWVEPDLHGKTGMRIVGVLAIALRSEERRVGKECRSRWSPYH